MYFINQKNASEQIKLNCKNEFKAITKGGLEGEIIGGTIDFLVSSSGNAADNKIYINLLTENIFGTKNTKRLYCLFFLSLHITR